MTDDRYEECRERLARVAEIRDSLPDWIHDDEFCEEFAYVFTSELGPMTLAEVGVAFGVTRERARQIEAKALRRILHPSRVTKLREYHAIH